MSVGLLAANREWAQVPDGYASLVEQLLRAPGVDPDRSALVDEAAAVWSRPGFDTVLSPVPAGLQPVRLPARRRADGAAPDAGARRSSPTRSGWARPSRPGWCSRELRMRGLADRALVITPAGLVDQWREELERKFGLPTDDRRRAAAGRSATTDRWCVASLAAARRDPLRSALTGREWDLVIVDEAHRLRNPRSASGRLARELCVPATCCCSPPPRWRTACRTCTSWSAWSRRACWAPPAQFRRAPRRRRHRGRRAAQRRRAARARPREVMVRHRRSEVAVLLPQRLAETVLVTARAQTRRRSTPSSPRGSGREARTPPPAQPAGAAQRWPGWPVPARLRRRPRWTSSAGPIWPSGPGRSPARRKFAELLVPAAHRTSGAARRCWCSPRSGTPWTRWPPRSRAAGIAAAVYHGSLSRAEKDAAVAAFAGDAPGPAVHRIRRRGPQPAVLPRHDQRRPAVEPDADRATARPPAPGRPGARRAADQPGRPRHHRAAHPARARSEDQPVRAGGRRAGHDPRPGRRRLRLRVLGVRRLRHRRRRRRVRRVARTASAPSWPGPAPSYLHTRGAVDQLVGED